MNKGLLVALRYISRHSKWGEYIKINFSRIAILVDKIYQTGSVVGKSALQERMAVTDSLLTVMALSDGFNLWLQVTTSIDGIK